MIVLLHHLRIPGAVFGAGYYAVDLFFMLSGYVLAQTYEPALRNGVAWPSFMRVRLERLYPMLFLGGLLGVALFPAFGALDGAEGNVAAAHLDWRLALAGQFLLVPYLATSAAFVFNNVQWSIVYELIANTVHSAGLRWLTNWVLALIAGISLIVMIAAAPRIGHLSYGLEQQTFGLGLARVGFGYSLGVLLQRTRLRWQGIVLAVPTSALIVVLLIVLGIPVLRVPGPVLQATALATLLVLVALVMFGSKAQGGDRLAAELGIMSYPLYAIQAPLLALVIWLLGDARATIPAAVPVGAVLICLLAWWVGHWIEQPLIRWRNGGAAQSAIRAARREG